MELHGTILYKIRERNKYGISSFICELFLRDTVRDKVTDPENKITEQCVSKK